MKKFTTTFAAMLLGLVPAMAAPTAPAGQWANTVNSTASTGTINNALAVTDDGSAIYWMGAGATKTSSDVVSYNGDAIISNPVATTRGSANNNLVIMRLDASGNKVWSVVSTYGDAASGNGGITLLPDGSLSFVTVMRHDEGELCSKPLVIVDAEGTATEVYGATETAHYVAVVAHLSAAGKLLSYGVIDPEVLKLEKDVTSAIFVKDIVATADGNILVGGNYRSTLHLKDAAGKQVTLAPKYLEGWTGDAQKAAGDMFLFKLTPDGRLLSSLEAQGSGLTNGTINSIAVKDSRVYLLGSYNVVEGADFTATFAGKALSATGVTNYFATCLNEADLTGVWHTNIVGQKVNNNCVLQNSGLAVAAGKVFVCGQFSGKFYPEGAEDKAVTSTTKVREGFLASLDAATGNWNVGVSSMDSFGEATYAGLTGYLDVITTDVTPGKVYVYGYTMKGGIGAFLRPYDAATLKANTYDAWTLVAGIAGDGAVAGMLTATNIAYAPTAGIAVCDVRGKNGIQPACMKVRNLGSTFISLITKFELPAELGAVNDIVVDNDNAAAPVEYYDLQGRRVSDTPAAGLYIRRQGTQAVKVLVR